MVGEGDDQDAIREVRIDDAVGIAIQATFPECHIQCAPGIRVGRYLVDRVRNIPGKARCKPGIYPLVVLRGIVQFVLCGLGEFNIQGFKYLASAWPALTVGSSPRFQASNRS